MRPNSQRSLVAGSFISSVKERGCKDKAHGALLCKGIFILGAN